MLCRVGVDFFVRDVFSRLKRKMLLFILWLLLLSNPSSEVQYPSWLSEVCPLCHFVNFTPWCVIFYRDFFGDQYIFSARFEHTGSFYWVLFHFYSVYISVQFFSSLYSFFFSGSFTNYALSLSECTRLHRDLHDTAVLQSEDRWRSLSKLLIRGMSTEALQRWQACSLIDVKVCVPAVSDHAS